MHACMCAYVYVCLYYVSCIYVHVLVCMYICTMCVHIHV